MSDTPLLAALLHPVRVDDFLHANWDKEFLHVRRNDPAYYHEILDVEELGRAFRSQSLHPSFLRVVRAGADRAASEWTQFEQRRHTEPYRVVQTNWLLELLSGGATVIVNAVERSIPSVTAWCRAFELELASRVQGNVYVTPPGAQGFSTHTDDHDMFVLQIHGTKHWRLYGNDRDTLDSRRAPAGEPERTIELREGDLLYLPRGVAHEASTMATASIHLTIGVHARRWYHLVEQLAKAAEASPEFQRSLVPLLLSHDRSASPGDEFFASLRRLLDDMRWPDLIEQELRLFDQDRLTDPGSWFEDMVRADRLTLESTVTKRIGVACRVERHDGKIHIASGRRTLQVARFLEGVVTGLLQERPVAVRDAAGPVPDDGKLTLARDLIRLGVLRIDSL